MTRSLFDRPAWFDQAACRGSSPDLFFPDTTAPAINPKAVCRACPVRLECLDHAIANDEQHGIWGGEALLGRRRIAAQRRREAS